jgi:hypothetical protein
MKVWTTTAGGRLHGGASAAVSPARHATPGIGRRSPATRMTEARIPLGLKAPSGLNLIVSSPALPETPIFHGSMKANPGENW